MKTNEELLKIAKEASKNAYCTYSKFPVGACVLFESGNVYSGCNVENSSFGLTLCAERNAISSAIANGEKSKLIKIAIYSPKTTKCYPCGACRQWIKEFSNGYNSEIIIENDDNKCFSLFLDKLLPYSFNLV